MKRRFATAENQFNIAMNDKVRDLFESSWSRVLQWMKDYDTATVTTFRSAFANSTKRCNQAIINKNTEEGHEFSRGENLIRNSVLHRILIAYGYGVTTIYESNAADANGTDVVEAGILGLFVVNLRNDKNFYKKVFELSEVFNQDSFLYKAKDDENACLVGTNLSELPGYGNAHLTDTLTSLQDCFMRRINNAASEFANQDNYIVKDKLLDLDSIMNEMRTYSWHEEVPPILRAKFEERLEYRLLIDDWHHLNSQQGVTLESIKDLSRMAKMSLIGVADIIKRGDR